MLTLTNVCKSKHCTAICWWECSYNDAGYRILLCTAPNMCVMVWGIILHGIIIWKTLNMNLLCAAVRVFQWHCVVIDESIHIYYQWWYLLLTITGPAETHSPRSSWSNVSSARPHTTRVSGRDVEWEEEGSRTVSGIQRDASTHQWQICCQTSIRWQSLSSQGRQCRTAGE